MWKVSVSVENGLQQGLAKLSSIDPMKFARPFTQRNGTVDAAINPLFKDYYDLLSVFAVAGLVFSFMVSGIKLLLSGFFSKPGTKEDIATALGSKIIAFGLFCGIVLFTRVVSDIVLLFI